MALNVLVVDDSQLSRAMILKALHLSGVPIAETFEACNGAEALIQLREHWVDIVLTDIHMPVMTGPELINQMRGDENLKGIPVMVVTSESSAEREAELQDEGIVGYLRKPFTPESIRGLLCQVTGVTS